MKRKAIAFVLMVAVLVMGVVPGQAHTRSEHDKQLEKVLFGRENYSASLEKKQKDAIKAIHAAAYLCLDQYNGHGMDDIIALKDYGIDVDIDSINFKGNYAHRMYTHKGWIPPNNPEKGNWPTRKDILQSTVNKVFDFGPFTDPLLFNIRREYTRQCDALCALIYYVHVLGDIEEIKDIEQFKKEGSYTIPLARANPGKDNTDILYDLCEKKKSEGANDDCYLKNLFPDKWNTNINCLLLRTNLHRIHTKASKLAADTGGINTEEKFQQYKQYCVETIDVLSRYIPKLLKQEKFFADVFYPVN